MHRRNTNLRTLLCLPIAICCYFGNLVQVVIRNEQLVLTCCMHQEVIDWTPKEPLKHALPRSFGYKVSLADVQAAGA